MKKINNNGKACLSGLPADRQGSMFVGVLVIVFLVLAIALAIVRRSTVGTMIVTDSRKGYLAYQDSDSSAEKILSSIKKLDGDATGRIPENTSAAETDFCSSGAVCYKENEGIIGSGDKVSDIDRIKQSGDEGVTKRAVSVPVPKRIENPLAGLSTKKGGTAADGTLNKCDMIVNWTLFDSNLPIKNLELRYSEGNKFLNAGNWLPFDPAVSGSISYGSSFLSTIIKNNNFKYGKTYYIAVKAKNKDNFALDSLYYPRDGYPDNAGVEFKTPAENCGGELGCRSDRTDGSEIVNTPYACCGGTECYQCDSTHKKSGENCVSR